MIKKEIWKDIQGYENKYQISNTYKVKSLNYNNTGKPKELKPKINKYGYLEVKLSKNNQTKNFLISTLVNSHFPKTIKYKNKIYKNKNELAKAYNITLKQLNKRLKRGWTLEESLEIPIKREYRLLNVKLYKYNGKLLSMKQLEKISGIDKKCLYKRLKRGWSIDEAVEIPLQKREVI